MTIIGRVLVAMVALAVAALALKLIMGLVVGAFKLLAGMATVGILLLLVIVAVAWVRGQIKT